MPFSHFRGGLKSPTRQSRSGDGAPPLPCNGAFTVNGFIPPVDALRHGRSRKPFAICSYEKRVRNSPAICTYKSKDLNFFGISTYKKQGVGGTPCFTTFASSTSFTSFYPLASLPRIT